jgi:hypothetical protein
VKILQHLFSIWPVHLTGAQHCIFPVCKLLIRKEREKYYPLPYIKHNHSCHTTVAFVVVIINFCILTNINLSHMVSRSVFSLDVMFSMHITDMVTVIIITIACHDFCVQKANFCCQLTEEISVSKEPDL